jgi:hypothetical protein
LAGAVFKVKDNTFVLKSHMATVRILKRCKPIRELQRQRCKNLQRQHCKNLQRHE